MGGITGNTVWSEAVTWLRGIKGHLAKLRDHDSELGELKLMGQVK